MVLLQQVDECVVSKTLSARQYETALLAKLQEMVPIMPRERQLSKLEIINYVIDYIRHLNDLVFDSH